MAQRRNSFKQQSKIRSNVLMACLLVLALLFTYFLVKGIVQRKKTTTAPLSFSIPRPEHLSEVEESELDEELAANTAENTEEPTFIDAPIAENPPKTLKEEIKSVIQAAPVIKDNGWRTVRPRSGDSMATIFHRLGLSAKTLHAVLQKNPHAKALAAIKPSQELKFLINKGTLEKLIIPINYVDTLTISQSKTGFQFHIDSKKTITKQLYVSATVRGSLYSAAQNANIPSKYVSKMTEILKREIDFVHGVHAGDHFSLIYDAYYIGDKMVGTGDLAAISYVNNGKTIQAIRHTSRNGTTDYYTPQGNSFKKAFSRYPIKFSHISSTFAISRNHPILHYKRAHKGIDLAAPIGTPIQATGDGVITVIDRHNGYGNMIKIKHDGKYSTLYGHLLKFQKGLSKGSRVKRGQVIGYVGQTGLATGPHCHYELHVNDEAKNPTTTNLPTDSPIPAREMGLFKTKTNILMAQLKSNEKAYLATNKKNNRNKVG